MGEEATENQQLVEIRPDRFWINFDLKELWHYRELIYFLTQREVKIRYKQTAIGVFWALLQPVLTTVVFTIVFSRFARFEEGEIPYPIFALSGLLLWLYVYNAVGNSSIALISNPSLVTKVYIPRVIVPLSIVLSGLVDLLIGLVILLGMLVVYGVPFTWAILMAPVFIALAILLALSFGILFSALNVRFRDVKHALPFVLQVWMFSSPVFYPAEMLSEKWRVLFWLNPMYGLLQGFRASFLGGNFEWPAIGVAVIIIFLLLIVSLFIFKRMEDSFADVI